MEKRISPQATLCCFGAFVFVLFGFIFSWVLWSEGHMEAVQTWPTTEAVIESATISSEYRRPVGTLYVHRLQYRFPVEGKIFVGQRLTYGGAAPSWSSEAQARRELPRVGSKVLIRYDPRDPTDSVVHVIQTTPGERRGLKAVAGSLGLAGGILMVTAGLAWLRKSRATHAPDPST